MLRRIAIALLLALLSTGCTMKAYEGPELPKSEIAVLREVHQHGVVLKIPLSIPMLRPKHVTTIIEIDGKSVSGTPVEGATIHILPGQHSARVHYFRSPGVSLFAFPNYETRDLSIGFKAKAGHQYRIPAERRGERNWIWAVDVKSGKVVAGEMPPDDKKAKGMDPAAPPK